MSSHVVSAESAGQRLDQFLRRELPEHSRAFLQKLIERGDARVNERAAKASYSVRAGDKINVEIPPPRPLEARAEDIPLDVLFEDDDLIVVNKPAGLVVHPAAGNQEHTLVNALLHYCRGRLAGIGGVERPGIVHRLDKGTSGCIVVAKTDFAHQALVAQFKSRGVKKIYRAVCWGKFAQPSGHIETVIGRSERDRRKMSARVARGRNAVTDYRVLKQLAEFALVELHIHTGRTHQIRVHMAHIGHPIVGDGTYGGARQTNISIARPLLHAYKLGFTHPRSQQFVEFTAPVPEDMVRLCET
jgi:23S rRNA pseudouridine1911/1915/1917 synthase